MLQLAVFRWAKNRFIWATSSGKPAASVPAVASSQSLCIPQCRVSPAGVWIAQEHFPKRKAYPHIVSEICCGPCRCPLGGLGVVTVHKDFFPSVGEESVNSPLPSQKREEHCGDELETAATRLLQMGPAQGQVLHPRRCQPEQETLCCFLLAEFWSKDTFQVF